MKPFCRTTALTVASSPLISLAQPAIETLPPVTVTASRNTEQDSEESAQERVKSLPGGASVISPDQWTGRTIAPEQVFQFEPGVFARSRGVANDTRISVRGSGLQRRFGDRGLTLLIDGIPANAADGSFYYRAIDPFSIDHLEVYRGANGLAYGGNQLGGAINIVQKNGLNAPGTFSQFEWGRHDTYRGHLSHGASNDKWDWYAGYSYAESDGYRERQDWQSHHFTTSLGRHWSESATTRFYFLFSDSDGALPGSLTPEQFKEDPRQADIRSDDADRDLTTIRIGQRTDWQTQDGSWSFYTNYQFQDFDHLINENSRGFDRLVDYETDEFQLGLTGSHRHRWLGIDNTLRLHTSANYGKTDENGFTTSFRGGKTIQNINRENTASNFQIYLENDAEFQEDHHLITGVGWVSARRKIDLSSADETGENSGTVTDDGFTYRLGYLYDYSKGTQFFTNFSQSFEASPFSEAGVSLNPDVPGFGELNPQLARTFEIGTRFSNSWANGELTFYYAKVKDEFVDVEVGRSSTTTNLDAVHKGIEAALTLNLSELSDWKSGPTLFFDQSYQLNDFEIDEGDNRGNQLPGVSKHVYSGRLRLEEGQQWSMALSAEWLPDGFVADNENSIKTDGFINWRIAGEFKINEHLRIYGGVDNLFDKSFVNSVTVNPSGAAYINPSNGRAAYVGLKYAW